MAAFPSRDRNSFTSHWTRILAGETIYIKTIMFDGQVAGNIVSWGHSGEREVGYWIGKEFWGKGITSRALSLFLNYIKERPLYAHVAIHNMASFQVLEKCGFKLAGDEQEEFILKLGS